MLKVFTLLLLFLFNAPVFVSAQVTLAGRITGVEGRPVPLANIFVIEPGSRRHIVSAAANRAGRFSVRLPGHGLWMVRFDGVFHDGLTMAIFTGNEKLIRVNVALGTYRYYNKFKKITVTGNFNSWYPPSAVTMHRRDDGIYVADVHTNAGPIAYQLTGVRKSPIEGFIESLNVAGTDAANFRYDSIHGYCAVVYPKHGLARIAFDPKRLPESNLPYRFRFADSKSVTAGFARVYDEMLRWKNDQTKVFAASKVPDANTRKRILRGIQFDVPKILTSLKERIGREPKGIVRELMYMNYIRLDAMISPVDSSVARKTLEEIPPSSVVWGCDPRVFNYALQYADFPLRKQRRYIERFLKENKSVPVRAIMLSTQFTFAKYAGQKETAKYYYKTLLANYGGTREAREIKKLWPNELRLQVGHPVPKFSVLSMDNPLEMISNETLHGKYYLLEFWATTSKPSVRQLRWLAEAYNRFKDKKFEIVSLSVDRSSKQVERFRRGTHRIPWLNGYIGMYLESKVAAEFDVTAIPSAFFVAPDGTLIAQGNDLLGPNLEKTLTKYLDRKEPLHPQ